MSKYCFKCYNKILQDWNPNKISTVTNEEISTQVTFTDLIMYWTVMKNICWKVQRLNLAIIQAIFILSSLANLTLFEEQS
jgi:hypothetical protein